MESSALRTVPWLTLSWRASSISLGSSIPGTHSPSDKAAHQAFANLGIERLEADAFGNFGLGLISHLGFLFHTRCRLTFPALRILYLI
jgi:hypothetical protein